MAERCRVLWLAKGLGPGGMERLLVHHAHFGDHERFDYRAAYLVAGKDQLVGELAEAGVPSVHLGDDTGNDPRWVARLRDYVRRERIDVVHAHSPLPAALARPALRAMRHRPRLVYTEHNNWDCYGPPTRTANLVTYALDDVHLAVSHDAADSVPGFLRRDVEVLTHGIDLDAVVAHRAHRDEVRAELGFGPDDVVVGTVANFRTEKDYPNLLDAAAAVVAGSPHARFVSVGQGPLRDELEAHRDGLGLGERFRFLGFRPDALRVMSAFDVFTLGSLFEGLPVAFMEARALGLPVVVTRVGGLVDHVDDGRDGLLVPARDAGALAEALGAVVGDAGRRAELAEASRVRSAEFDARTAVRLQEQRYLGVGARS